MPSRKQDKSIRSRSSFDTFCCASGELMKSISPRHMCAAACGTSSPAAGERPSSKWCLPPNDIPRRLSGVVGAAAEGLPRNPMWPREELCESGELHEEREAEKGELSGRGRGGTRTDPGRPLPSPADRFPGATELLYPRRESARSTAPHSLAERDESSPGAMFTLSGSPPTGPPLPHFKLDEANEDSATSTYQ